MAEAYDAVVAGHICLDVFPGLAGLEPGVFTRGFVPGRLLEVGPVTVSTGGAVSNTGVVMNLLGVPTYLMGKVGDDLFGRALRGVLEGYGQGLTGGMIIDPAASSSYTVVINPPGIDRIFLHHPGPNDTFRAADVRYDLVARTRLLHFGYPPVMRAMFENDGCETVELFKRARAVGVTTSLDMSLPDASAPSGRADWKAILAAALPYVDLFLPSIEEVLYMLHRSTSAGLLAQWQAAGEPGLLSELARQIIDMGAKIVVLKLGDRGLYMRTAGRAALETMGRAQPGDPAAWAGRELWAPCFRVKVVGTTGAGDATIAGFLTAFLRGLSPERSVTAAVAVGACNVEAADALSGIRNWNETMQRAAAGWPRCTMTPDAPGWRFDAHAGLWHGPGDRE